VRGDRRDAEQGLRNGQALPFPAFDQTIS
jgi:hypothetical protein